MYKIASKNFNYFLKYDILIIGDNMASRMERYLNSNEGYNRSTKNKNLYKEIQNLDSYTNIEAVSTIEKTNEIDITKVKELLKNRENYKKEKKYLQALNKKQDKKEELVKKYEEPEKSYDIKEVLDKAKIERKEEKNRYHDLKNTQYNILKSLQLKDKDYTEEEELKELIYTITNNSKLNKLANEDSGLLDDLKSDTMVGDADSIKKIIDEEKNNYQDDTMDLDKSFFTSSLGFKAEDFEDLKDIKHNIKKNNLLIKVLLGVIGVAIVGFIVFMMLK